jgi:hypothetical protein
VAELPRALRSAGWSCVAVGGGDEATASGWNAVEWSPEAEEDWLARATVGLMPQASDGWSDRKAAYKIFEYVAAGVVPVASDVLPARLILEGRDLGRLIVSDLEGWRSSIEYAALHRERLMSVLRSIALAHSADACLAKWLPAVGISGRAS